MLEKILTFFKKNGVLLIQIAVMLLPLMIFLEYYAISGSESDDVVSSIDAVETVKTPAEPIQKVEQTTDEKKEVPQSDVSTFEIDEVSQEMLDKTSKNPKELLSGNSPCTHFDDVHVVSKHTGTISKAKNAKPFKTPLPALISEIEYSCVDNVKGTKRTKTTTMGVAVDAEANTLRCVQSITDDTMDSDARFKHVVKIMTHHCGFKLSEHHTTSTTQP